MLTPARTRDTMAYALDREPELVRRIGLIARSRLETSRADLALAVALLSPLVGSGRGCDVIPSPRADDARREGWGHPDALRHLAAMREARAAETPTLSTAETWLRSADAWHIVWGYVENLLRVPSGRKRRDAWAASGLEYRLVPLNDTREYPR